MIRWAKRVLFALSVSCIALLPQFYSIFKAENRYDLFWNHTNHAAIAAAVVVLAAIFGLVYALVYHAWKPVRVHRYLVDVMMCLLLYFILARTGVALLDRAHFLESGWLSFIGLPAVKVAYYFLLPLPVIATWTEFSKRALRRAYALLAPAVVTVLVWPLAFHTYQTSMPELPASVLRSSGESRQTTNIYIFIFDEWSYARAFPGDKVWGPMTNLAALVSMADLYERASSPATFTRLSVPRFLYQGDPHIRSLDDGTVLQLVTWGMPRASASIFQVADPSWFKAALSFYIDIPGMLRTQVDYGVRVYGQSNRRFDQQVSFLLRSQIAWIGHLGIPFHQFDIHPSYYWANSQALIHQQTLRIINEVDRPTMALFHYCLPHAPFVWNRNGRKVPLPHNFADPTLSNYKDNLLYLDRVIGEIVEALKRSGKFDNSLLICTSDHSWRSDPTLLGHETLEEAAAVDKPVLTHVPLIIKNVGQTEGKVIMTPVQTQDIYPIIARAAGKEE